MSSSIIKDLITGDNFNIGDIVIGYTFAGVGTPDEHPTMFMSIENFTKELEYRDGKNTASGGTFIHAGPGPIASSSSSSSSSRSSFYKVYRIISRTQIQEINDVDANATTLSESVRSASMFNTVLAPFRGGVKTSVMKVMEDRLNQNQREQDALRAYIQNEERKYGPGAYSLGPYRERLYNMVNEATELRGMLEDETRIQATVYKMEGGLTGLVSACVFGSETSSMRRQLVGIQKDIEKGVSPTELRRLQDLALRIELELRPETLSMLTCQLEELEQQKKQMRLLISANGRSPLVEMQAEIDRIKTEMERLRSLPTPGVTTMAEDNRRRRQKTRRQRSKRSRRR